MKLWKVALVAFAAMMIQDLLATTMVIFESRYEALMAGAFDVLGYLATTVCAFLALDSIIKNGWRNSRSLVIIASVSVANFAGTFIGVGIGAAIAHHRAVWL